MQNKRQSQEKGGTDEKHKSKNSMSNINIYNNIASNSALQQLNKNNLKHKNKKMKKSKIK